MALNGISFVELPLSSTVSCKLAELIHDFLLACSTEVHKHFAKTVISLPKIHLAR